MGLNPLEAASALAGPVGLLGGWFMASKSTYAYGGELGFEGMTFYYLGRGGAMGDVKPEVVASAMTFFPAGAGGDDVAGRQGRDEPRSGARRVLGSLLAMGAQALRSRIGARAHERTAGTRRRFG